jgi:hypothetical protein
MNHSLKIQIRNVLSCAAAIALASCATMHKGGSDARIENLRTFHLAFIDEFATSDKPFDAVAFEEKVKDGDRRFQEAIVTEKFTARIAVLKDLNEQFKADANHIRSKAKGGKITKALATEMKRDTNDNYDRAIGKKH